MARAGQLRSWITARSGTIFIEEGLLVDKIDHVVVDGELKGVQQLLRLLLAIPIAAVVVHMVDLPRRKRKSAAAFRHHPFVPHRLVHGNFDVLGLLCLAVLAQFRVAKHILKQINTRLLLTMLQRGHGINRDLKQVVSDPNLEVSLIHFLYFLYFHVSVDQF